MTSTLSQLVPIECVAGVDTDNTALTAKQYTWSKAIRFVRGIPEKIGGWVNFQFAGGATIVGTARSLYSASIAGRIRTVIGTDERLYDVFGSTLTNITPLEVTTIAIPNSIDTHYATLANNPVSTVNGSNTVTIADSEAALFEGGDTYILSGATAVGGISAGLLNASHIVRSVGVGTIQIRVASSATSSATGGGAAVVRTSGLLTFTDAAHGQEDGDRVKITDAADTGGILAADINLEFIIRNVTISTFDVMTDSFATSSVTAGGGAGVAYQEQIPPGELNESFGQGYGMGMYGAGLYGVSKISNTVRRFPRIWFFDRFGDIITMTPGNQGGLYQWDGDSSIAPTLITGAPSAINYQFVSDNILVTLGAGGIDNKVFASDNNDFTQWVASSTNQVFEDNIEGAGRLMSHVQVNSLNLLFTENQTYLFSYIGLPLVWSIELKEPNIGIIAPMARVSVNGAAYWMDDGNFYYWSGGNISVIPSNTGYQSTIHSWMYDDLNYSQKSKSFAWYNPQFNEVWFHSLSMNENEPDKIARLNILDFTWCPDYIQRTAAEYPNISLFNPRLMNEGLMYKHEQGYNDDTLPLDWQLQSNNRTLGRDFSNIDGIIPDSIQNEDISINITGRRFPQSTALTYDKTFDVSPTTERIPYTTNGGYWKYMWSGSALNQFWRMGTWQEYLQKAGKN
jgi:hypothetical protein